MLRRFSNTNGMFSVRQTYIHPIARNPEFSEKIIIFNFSLKRVEIESIARE